MKFPRRRFLHLAAGAAALPALPRIAKAQAYPTRHITVIVPFSAQGTATTIARIVCEHMARTLGQPLVVENVAGAGGTAGSIRTMRANPDGYTIELGNLGTHGASVGLYPNLAYKPDVDFMPIGLAAGTPILIVARKDFPANNLQEFVAYLKANATKLNCGHNGVGSTTFTTALLLHSILNVKPALIPYAGSSPTLALVAGQVDYMTSISVTVVPQIQSGEIKAYAVASEERMPVLPNLPTSIEAGLPEFQVSGWNGFFAPKGTPNPVVEELSNALNKALDDDDIRKRLFELGCDIPGKVKRGSQPLAELVKSEIARLTPIIRAANVKLE